MRIESLEYYKYFFHSVKEEPLQIKRYSLFLLLIPIIGLCHYFEWNKELLLFFGLGYLSMAIGYYVAISMRSNPVGSLKKQYLNNLIAENIPDMVMVMRNSDQKIIYSNSVFCNKLLIDREDLSGIRISDFVDQNDQYLFQDNSVYSRSKFAVRPLNKIENKPDQIRVISQAGKRYTVDMTSVVTGDLADFTMYIFKDITESDTLQKANRQFALDLRARKEAFNSLSYRKPISTQSIDRVFS